jgi:predicted alpha-1,6-mannanase (GH76 family)
MAGSKYRGRTRALTAGAVTAALALLVPAAASAAAAPAVVTAAEAQAPTGSVSMANQGRVDAARAASSFAALQRYFLAADGSGLYREQYPVETSDNDFSYEWPFSQAHVAVADMANLPGRTGRQYMSALRKADGAQQRYWQPAGGTNGIPGYASYVVGADGAADDFYYDDNEWVGLLDVQRNLTGSDPAALKRAQQVFALVVSGWDTDATHAAPGGVFWSQLPGNTDRNTVSNMPGAALGLRLYQLTGQRVYFDWAKKMYDWTNRNLQQPNGLFSDHLSITGTVEPTVWSYNQGVPIGVNVMLYQITHDGKYLGEAERIAAAASSYYGTDGRLLEQPAVFNSIFFKNTLLLESVAGGSKYRKAAQTYADAMWTDHRDAATGLFHFGSDHTQVIEQSAMTQIYAVLAWSPAQWRNLS